jgi:hypothetical protein
MERHTNWQTIKAPILQNGRSPTKDTTTTNNPHGDWT